MVTEVDVVTKSDWLSRRPDVGCDRGAEVDNVRLPTVTGEPGDYRDDPTLNSAGGESTNGAIFQQSGVTNGNWPG